MSKKLFATLLILAIFATFASVLYEGTYTGIVGASCGADLEHYCYQELPTNGFPLWFMRDKGYINDVEFNIVWFFVDVIVYFVVILLIVKVLQRYLNDKKRIFKKRNFSTTT